MQPCRKRPRSSTRASGGSGASGRWRSANSGAIRHSNRVHQSGTGGTGVAPRNAGLGCPGAARRNALLRGQRFAETPPACNRTRCDVHEEKRRHARVPGGRGGRVSTGFGWARRRGVACAGESERPIGRKNCVQKEMARPASPFQGSASRTVGWLPGPQSYWAGREACPHD